MLERKWWTLAAVCVAIFMLLLDITIVNVALPAIQRSLHASFTELQWVVDAYALTLATTVLAAGSLADLVGRKRVFVSAVALFSLASLLCALATGPLFLILARAAQGIGGAAMFATSLALISQEFHGRDRGTAFGIWGATTGAAVAIGPLVGGMLTSWLSWHWIFYVNVPIGVALVAGASVRLHESRDPEHGGVDWLGLLTLSGGLFALVFALLRGNNEGWSSALIVGLLAAAGVLLAAWLVSQALLRSPGVDLRLFRKPAFVGAQAAAFALSASQFSMFLYLTLYLQNVLGYSPLQAGLRFLPTSLLAFAAAPVSGKLSSHVPPRLLLGAGLGLVGVGMVLNTVLVDSGSGWTALLPGFIVGGAGVGLANPPIAVAAIGTAPREQAGMASGVNNTFRQVGIATGIAFLGVLFQHHIETRLGLGHGAAQAVAAGRVQLAGARAAFVSGLDLLFVVCAAVAFAGAAAALLLVRRRDFAARY